jgi:hypothetical protein
MAKKFPNMGESPLLSNERPLSTSFKSTIKSEEFEPRRLTERQLMEEDGNSIRILIYVIIVIIIGVGTALLIRSLISRNENNSTEQEEQTTVEQEETTNNALKIGKVVLADASATNVASNSDYDVAAISTLGDAALNVSTVSLNLVEVNPYTTFTRVKFDLTGTTTSIPKTTLNFDSVKKQLSIEFPTGMGITQDLKRDSEIGGLIKELRFDTINNKFILVLNEDAKYRVFQATGDLFIDFKTVSSLVTTNETTTPTDQTATDTNTNTDTSTDTSTTKPTDVNYTNEFSQAQQYIVSKVTGNTIGQNKYYFYDAGEHFEFSWGHKGNKGDDYIPNATAYYKEENSKTYIYVEIENLSQEIFLSNNATGTDLAEKADTSASNFVRIDLVKFENGKATYKVEVKKKTDFSIVAEEAYGEVGQLITLKMKD